MLGLNLKSSDCRVHQGYKMTKLKEMRSKKKMLLKEVAAVVGTTPQTVQQMERRGIWKATTAQRYAKAFGCRWDELLETSEDETDEQAEM